MIRVKTVRTSDGEMDEAINGLIADLELEGAEVVGLSTCTMGFNGLAVLATIAYNIE